MSEPNVGTVVLGGVTLTADPIGYGLNWPPRRQIFSGPGGWTTGQDFGMHVGDATLELSSGDTGPLTTIKVQALLALERVKGATYQFNDAFDNSATVLILDFKPTHRVAGLWDYTLTLAVRTATRILGVAEV